MTAPKDAPTQGEAGILYVSQDALEAGLAHIQQAPKDNGEVLLIVRRPERGVREVLQEALLDETEGLRGDNWHTRGSSRTNDGNAHPEMQLTLMNARVIELLTQEQDQWPWAGDQLYIDLDLSDENLPPGTQLTIGDAIVEVTAVPHTGCLKFRERFGPDALRFVNNPRGRQHNLRGINAKIVKGGTIRQHQHASKRTS